MSQDTAAPGKDKAPRKLVKGKDFVRGLARRSGTTPEAARTAAAEVLAELIAQLEDGTEVVLPKVGRIRQVRSRDGKNGPVRVLRLAAAGKGADAED